MLMASKVLAGLSNDLNDALLVKLVIPDNHPGLK